MKPARSRPLKVAAASAAAALLGFFALTLIFLEEIPKSPEAALGAEAAALGRSLALDRFGARLSFSLGDRWNFHDQIRWEETPELLKRAVVESEDKRFFSHAGVDWLARGAAVAGLVRSGRLTRGASTITEQVVRILHPRPRNLWSRWLETWEAMALERRWGKISLLEFYVNQVPFAKRRRGFRQAARLYFDRDLGTLSAAETLALVAAVRAPSAFAPGAAPGALESRAVQLAPRLGLEGDPSVAALAAGSRLEWREGKSLAVEAGGFLRMARERRAEAPEDSLVLETTLHGELQSFGQKLVGRELRRLKDFGVEHAAFFVMDHRTGEVLGWGGAGETDYDTVRVRRQPGSTMKPFLYALALESGWNPATIIVDEPMQTAVGRGLHPIRNYSRLHYGPVTLREALGNSLNVPAVKTSQFVGGGKMLELLKKAGFAGLGETAEFYGDSLALGSGEVSLYELVRAYTAFAGGGQIREPRFFPDQRSETPAPPIFSRPSAELISHILADPAARALEFGTGSFLHMPIPTAIKTGTSTDYRDAWAVAFNGRFIAGVWMGSLARRPMAEVSGAKSPALMVRSLLDFLDEANGGRVPGIAPPESLVSARLCRSSDRILALAPNQPPPAGCAAFTEFFPRDTDFAALGFGADGPPAPAAERFRILHPVPRMEVAIDPRISRKSQALKFVASEAEGDARFDWFLNGRRLARTEKGVLLWPIERGRQSLRVERVSRRTKIRDEDEVEFVVR